VGGQFLAIVVLFVCTVGYLGCVLYLINFYLPRHQPNMWAKLGRPVIQHPIVDLRRLPDDIHKWLVTGRFMLLSNQYLSLKDQQLAHLLWCIRTLAVGGLTAWVLLVAVALTGQPR
jgi:hypothetical protein